MPIIFVGAGDALANGIVKSLARPEGNTTGITNRFASIGGKMVELLKEAVPSVERVGLVYDSQILTDDSPQFPPIDEAARLLNIRATKIPFRNAVDLVHGIDAFAAEPNGALFVLAPPPIAANRETIIQLATQHRLPTIFVRPGREPQDRQGDRPHDL
jgi:putative ABC transport system substrate-binding protein